MDTQEQAYPSPGQHECRSVVLDPRDLADDSTAQGSRGRMMKGCAARLRILTFSGIQWGEGSWEA